MSNRTAAMNTASGPDPSERSASLATILSAPKPKGSLLIEIISRLADHIILQAQQLDDLQRRVKALETARGGGQNRRKNDSP